MEEKCLKLGCGKKVLQTWIFVEIFLKPGYLRQNSFKTWISVEE